MRDTECTGDAIRTSRNPLIIQLRSSLAAWILCSRRCFWTPFSRSCCCSAAKSCPTLCAPTDCSTPGFPVPHSLGVCSNACPLSRWCHLTISPSATLFPFGLPSCPADRPMFFQFYLTRTLPLLHSSSNPVLFPRISWGPTQPSLKLFLKISAYYIRLPLSELFTPLICSSYFTIIGQFHIL